MNKCYIEIHSTNKAKNDIDILMNRAGYRNIGSSKRPSGKIGKFFIKLGIMLKIPFCLHKNEVLLIQYPFKKYYPYLCRIAHFRKCKVVTLIHDLGSFRRQKLTVSQEIKKLSHSDYIIVHNPSMKRWLEEQGCQVPMGCLEIFDYLSETKAVDHCPATSVPKVIYAGGLGPRKNAFLYQLDDHISSYELHVYGKGLDEKVAQNWKHIVYKGFMPSDELISTNRGHFGLVWDGDSISACDGNWGEYLQYNNPHKTSFYIRCHLPVIIWNKAALAPFIRENKIGICVDSLEELNQRFSSMKEEEYAEIRKNIIAMSDRLSEGYYFYKAMQAACEKIRGGE